MEIVIAVASHHLLSLQYILGAGEVKARRSTAEKIKQTISNILFDRWYIPVSH